MLVEPSARVVSVSTAPSAIPADTATSELTPWAVSANATAALETPTFPGVSGRIPARSSAGMISTAAASGRSIPKAAAIPVAASDPQRPSRADPAGDLRRSARTAPEDAEDVERVAELRSRPRVTGAPRDRSRDSGREQQHRDRPARQHAARRREREHDREPHGPHRAQRAGDPADRPEPAFVVEHAREEGEANGRADPGRRERVHDRAGAVARGRVGPRGRAAAARQRRLPAARRRHQRAAERGRREPEPAGRRIREPGDSVGDEIAEQLRTQRQRDQRCDRSQEHGDVPFPQLEVQVHLVTTFRVGHEFLQVLSASPPHLYPQFMQGAIAAGNKVTAEAGASVLAEGGNAIDACIVAAFAAAVAEGPLTGPTGGGFLLAWVDGEATVLDCFFAAPSRPLGEIEDITVDFGDSTQSYHVGAGSVAVPGLVAGLEEAHRRFGSVPWPQLVEPAIELAARGLDVDGRTALPAPDPRWRSCSATKAGAGSTASPTGSRRPTSSRRSSGSATSARQPSASCCPSSPTTSPATPSPRPSRCARASARSRS